MKHFSLRSVFFVAASALAVSLSAPAADLSVTAASFQAGAGAETITGTAGAAITAGQLLTISPSTGRFVLASATDSTLCKVVGIAAGNAAAGQKLVVITYAPNLTLGATLDMSYPVYVLSGTAGAIAPVADLGAGGKYPVVVLVATSTTTCLFRAPSLTFLQGTTVTVAD